MTENDCKEFDNILEKLVILEDSGEKEQKNFKEYLSSFAKEKELNKNKIEQSVKTFENQVRNIIGNNNKSIYNSLLESNKLQYNNKNFIKNVKNEIKNKIDLYFTNNISTIDSQLFKNLPLMSQTMSQLLDKYNNNYNNDVTRNEAQPENIRTGQTLRVIVSHIESGTMFYVNEADHDSDELDKMEEEMLRLKPVKIPKVKPRLNVAASYDDLYSRARLQKPDKRDPNKKNMWFVMFIDYGNRATISTQNMARLPDHLSTNKIAPLAIKCQLAGLRAPSTKHGNRYFQDSGMRFSQLAMGRGQNHKVLTMKILYDDYRAGRWLVELFKDKECTQSINKQMVREGMARISQPGVFPADFEKSEDEYTKEYLQTIKQLKDDAVHGLRGMHEWGELM